MRGEAGARLYRRLIFALVVVLAIGPAEISYATNLTTARLSRGEPSAFLGVLKKLDNFLCPPVYALDNEHAKSEKQTSAVDVQSLRPPSEFSGRPTNESSNQATSRGKTENKGRFISRDPLGVWGDASQLGNANSAFGNNPVNRIDPFGLDDVYTSKEQEALEKRLAEVNKEISALGDTNDKASKKLQEEAEELRKKIRSVQNDNHCKAIDNKNDPTIHVDTGKTASTPQPAPKGDPLVEEALARAEAIKQGYDLAMVSAKVAFLVLGGLYEIYVTSFTAADFARISNNIICKAGHEAVAGLIAKGSRKLYLFGSGVGHGVAHGKAGEMGKYTKLVFDTAKKEVVAYEKGKAKDAWTKAELDEVKDTIGKAFHDWRVRPLGDN